MLWSVRTQSDLVIQHGHYLDLTHLLYWQTEHDPVILVVLAIFRNATPVGQRPI